MSFASPWFLIGLVLGLPVVLAFMVKRRRNVVRVPSTMLWLASSVRKIKNRKIRNLTRLLALLACLLSVLFLAIAASKPQYNDRQTIAFVVDISASMGQVRDGQIPIEEAQSSIRRHMWLRDPQNHYVLIAAGENPQCLAGPTSNGAELRQAIERLEASRSSADLPAALRLAEGLIRNSSNPKIILFHDGGQSSTPLSDNVTSSQVSLYEAQLGPSESDNENGHNVGIVTFSAIRPADASGEDEREVNIVVATSSDQPRQVLVEVKAFDTTIAERTVDLDARGEDQLNFRLSTPANEMSASVTALDGLDDVLSSDDIATLEQGSPVPDRVLLVAPSDAPESETFFLTQALRASGVTEIIRATPEEAHTRSAHVDIAVVTSQPPRNQLDIPTLYLATTGTAMAAIVPNQREISAHTENSEEDLTGVFSVQDDHPLLAGVDLDGITIDHAIVADTSEQSLSLVQLEGGDVLFVGGQTSSSFVYIGLDPRQSDLVLRVAFPVLVANSLALLGGASQIAIADTLPRSEVTLARNSADLDLRQHDQPLLTIPKSPIPWLVLFGALLLSSEALLWKKGWTQ